MKKKKKVIEYFAEEEICGIRNRKKNISLISF